AILAPGRVSRAADSPHPEALAHSRTPTMSANVEDAARTFQYLAVEKDGPVTTVTLSRPEKYNALNRALLGELEQVVASLRGDTSTRALVVTGAGDKAFVSGADISELAPLDTRGAEEASAYGSRIFRQLETAPQFVIAAVNGFALGGGCELALACHAR